jgi:hypothetical protein
MVAVRCSNLSPSRSIDLRLPPTSWGPVSCTSACHKKSKELAGSYARAVFQEAAREDTIGAGMPPLSVVGQFNLPPPGARGRDFQALHMDFGLPVVPDCPSDAARFTALYVDRDRPLEFDRNGFPVAQRTPRRSPDFVARVDRILSP